MKSREVKNDLSGLHDAVMLSKNEAYNAELYRKADKPPVTRELTTAQAVAFLRSKGFVILDEETGKIA